MVCKVLITLASANLLWICSPRESVFDTESVGACPWRSLVDWGYVYEDLAVKVLLTSLLERLQRYGAGCCGDDHLAVGGCITESAELHLGCSRCQALNGGLLYWSGSVRESVTCVSRVPTITS